jgi:hypothetical protein
VIEAWQFAPIYGLAALPLQQRFKADGMTAIQLNLVMKLLDGDMLEWIHGQLHAIKTGKLLTLHHRRLLAGTPFGSRVLSVPLLYSLMNS